MTEGAAQFICILTITAIGLRQTPNGHIAKIAALPSFEKVCYFCRELLVGKRVESRNFSNMLGVGCKCGNSRLQKTEFDLFVPTMARPAKPLEQEKFR